MNKIYAYNIFCKSLLNGISGLVIAKNELEVGEILKNQYLCFYEEYKDYKITIEITLINNKIFKNNLFEICNYEE